MCELNETRERNVTNPFSHMIKNKIVTFSKKKCEQLLCTQKDFRVKKLLEVIKTSKTISL